MVGSRSILVVEPDGDDRGGLAGSLRGAGLLIDIASDAASALSTIESTPHVMIVVDQSTPGLNVAALGDSLRRMARRPMALLVADDIDAIHRAGVGDVVHGYLRRSELDGLPDLVRDCLAALRDSKPVALGPLAGKPISPNA
jgi:CheY-like chemotaxis protein